MKAALPVLMSLLIIMPYFIPANTEAGTPSVTVLAAVKTDGNGVCYPFGKNIILPMHPQWVIWCYYNGTTITRYLKNPNTIQGAQFAITYVLIGEIDAPRLLQQPGNISANMLVLAGVIMPM
ncbi:MAG: hypothetical protein J7K61_03565 [Thermoplasmata archaeon]|nr:hypothetical protein [Thermoplasmata archaeon]